MNEAPLACSLEAGALAERLAWIAELSREALRSHRRDGLTLHLAYDAGASERVRELVRRESACCGFLSFDLTEHGDRIELVVTAPEAAGAQIDLLFEHFVAG
jgi:hypothetical protein